MSSAIQRLKLEGVKEERIIFANVISCQEGIDNVSLINFFKVLNMFPKILIVTAQIEFLFINVSEGLDGNKYIVPGLGDFGCRYFGTDFKTDQ